MSLKAKTHNAEERDRCTSKLKIKRLHIQIGVEALAAYLGTFFAVFLLAYADILRLLLFLHSYIVCNLCLQYFMYSS